MYLVHQIFFRNLDGVLLGSVTVALIRDLLGNQLLQDEEQQLVVISSECQIPCKRLKKCNKCEFSYQRNEDLTEFTRVAQLDRYNQFDHLPHAPHHAELLRVNEAFQHDTDSHVHVVLQHVIPQMHAGVCLSHADHGLYVTHGNRDTSCSLRDNIRLL